MKPRFLTAEQAAALIPSDANMITEGFVGAGVAEEVHIELERRFLETGKPRGLTLMFPAGQGDGGERGINHLGHEGLVRRVIGGHWNLLPKIQKLAVDNKIEAYNLPQGVISHMLRDIAAHKPGTLTHVGLRTFVDPRLQGGKLNQRTTEDIVKLIEIDGREYLLYKGIPLNVAVLRGTYADENGNVTMEQEGVTVSALSAAQAVKNSGGIVIVQVKEIVQAGSLDPRLVRIPGIYVDVVVKNSKPECHMQTFVKQYDPSYCGEARVPLSAIEPMAMDERKIVCRRAAQELKKDSIVNLGIGMPEGIALVANEQGRGGDFVLTVEAGPIAGVPLSGLEFGCAVNPEAIIDQANQFDSYQGGGVDTAFLGLAQADRKGNINVSKFGPRIAGCGGFIDITQNAKSVVYCGTFMAKGLKIAAGDGKLTIEKEGAVRKFVSEVEQVTFSGDYANEVGQPVLYITERAVFRLTPEGLELIEYAPGIDIERDIIANMDFRPIVKNPIPMSADIFTD